MPKPTFPAPRFLRGTTYVDLPDIAPGIPPVLTYQHTKTGLRGMNLTANGRAEYLYSRTEEGLALDFLCEPETHRQMDLLFSDWAVQGNAFQAWLDRYTGSCWLFQHSLKDQNGLAWTLNGGGNEVYIDYDATTPGPKALQLSGPQYLSVPLAQNLLGFDDPLSHLEGVLVLDFKPAWAPDGTMRTILQTSASVAGTIRDMLWVYVDSFNSLVFAIYDDAEAGKQVAGAVSWSVGTRVRIITSWTGGTLKAWYATGTGAFTELTGATGSGTGTMLALPTTLYLGASRLATEFSPGIYARVLFLKRAWSNPHLTLADYKPVERNYFARAEWAQPIFQAARFVPSRQVWRYQVTLRNGVF